MNDFGPVLCFTIMRMTSVPSQHITSSVLSRSSRVLVTTHTEGYRTVFTVLFCHVCLLVSYCFILSYMLPLTKRFLQQNSLVHFLFLPSQSRAQYTVPLLIFTIVRVLEGLYK